MTTIVDGPSPVEGAIAGDRLEVVRQTESSPEAEPGKDNGRRRQRIRIVAAVVALALLAAAARYTLYWRHYETTDDAFVDGAVVEIAPQVAGRIAAVHVSDNQWVEAGTLLVEIDPDPYRTRLDVARSERDLARARVDAAELSLALTSVTAESDVLRARADVAAAEAEVARAQADVTVAEADAARAEADRIRYQKLDGRAASDQQRERAVASARAAKARVEASRRRVDAAQARLAAARAALEAADTAEDRIAAARAELDRARAELARAEARLESAQLDFSYTSISAPAAGYVVSNQADVGEIVRPGQILMAVVPGDLWVTANFKETQLTDMRPGQPVDIRVDAYPDLRLHGHVDSFQRGTGAHFSLFPPENATGSYVKVVQRVPVKIVFDDPPDQEYLLAPGMSVVPSVRVR